MEPRHEVRHRPHHAGMRHALRQKLEDLEPQLFRSYLAYLQGGFVWNLVARGPDGAAMASPDGNQLLQHEVVIRKQAWRKVAYDGSRHTLAEALRIVRLDPTAKERHLTTPIALNVFAERAAPPDPNDDYKKKGVRGEHPRGKGKRQEGR